MTDQELYHYGVKGMKWGVRKKSYNPDAKVRKSARTKTFEKLANSGERRARQQDSLYEAFGDQRNKKSADQWRMEAAQNREAAKQSYERDVFNKTASRKQKKELAAKQQAWDDNYKKNQLSVYNNTIDRINETLVPKFNKKIDKEFKGQSFDEVMKDPKKKARYEQLYEEHMIEGGKMLTDAFLEAFGERPTYRSVLETD